MENPRTERRTEFEGQRIKKAGLFISVQGRNSLKEKRHFLISIIMRSWASCGGWWGWRSELLPVAPLARRLMPAGFRLILSFLLVSAARAQAPRLELSPTPEGRTVQLRLTGETNRAYVVEISTNLTSWQTLTQLQATNGTATLLYDATQSHHSFLRARAEETARSVTPQVAPGLGVRAFISADGGDLELMTPDLRTITLSIPQGCIINPVEVRMSVVTNLVGLPFAKGTFGTVQIEPQGLVLLGAAQLSIEYPPGLDRRSVVSFSANNDGTAWALTADVAHSNRVVIPLSDFAMYGSAEATLAEVEAAIAPTARVSQLSSQASTPIDPREIEICRRMRPEVFDVNLNQFPPSSLECFEFMVNRAIAAQRELRAILNCVIMRDLGEAIAIERQKQLFLGGPDESYQILSNGVMRICPLYQGRIEPLWEEAKVNCPLSIVLMQFMLGFEQQVQVLGLTSLASCNYTLFGNLDKVCKSAEGCLQQIKACCDLGRKGQEKYLEISKIVKQFESVGDTSCFPAGMDEPLVQEVLDRCLTNAWYGSFQVRRYGGGTTNFVEGNYVRTQSAGVREEFDGAIFSSDEDQGQPSDEPRSVLFRIIGTGSLKEENTLEQTTRTPCLNTNSTAVSYSRSDRLITGSLTLNGGEDFPKVYLLLLEISADNTTYSAAGTAPSTIGKQKDQSYSKVTQCDGTGEPTPSTPNEFDATVGIQSLSFENHPIGADTNILHGTRRVIGTLPPLNFPMTTDFSWNFRRVRQR